MNHQHRRATKTTNPYSQYKIGVSRDALDYFKSDMSQPISDNDVRTMLRDHVADMYRQKRIPIFTVAVDVDMIDKVVVQIDPVNQTIAVWMTPEAEGGKRPVVISGSEDCPYCTGTLPHPPKGHNPNTVH